MNFFAEAGTALGHEHQTAIIIETELLNEIKGQ